MLPPDAPGPASDPSQLEADVPADASRGTVLAPPAESADAGTASPSRTRMDTPARRRFGRIVVVATAIVVVLAGSGLFAAGFVLGSQTSDQPGTPADAAADFQPFWDTYAAINQHFAGEPVSRQTLVQGAIKGTRCTTRSEQVRMASKVVQVWISGTPWSTSQIQP